VKLRNFSVELMKITPFNGSNFFNGSKPFLGGTAVNRSGSNLSRCPGRSGKIRFRLVASTYK
jgi:hypothetical protein